MGIRFTIVKSKEQRCGDTNKRCGAIGKGDVETGHEASISTTE